MYESCKGAGTLPEQENTSGSYQETSGTIPQLRSTDSIRRQTEIKGMNRALHVSIDSETLLQMLASGTNCHLERIKRFGCAAFARVPKAETISKSY